MSRVLVTGGGGFLGKAVVGMLLARGDDVTVLARGDYPDLRQMGAKTLRGDVADKSITSDACADKDIVFHVAAKAGVWGRAADYDSANIEGTQNVIDGCIARSVPRLVATSSPSVTFDGRDAANADESLPYPTKHLYHYGRTKAEAERRVLQANASAHKTGVGVLLTCALRPHIIYGPGDPHILPRLVSRHRQGRLMIVGNGRNLVDVTYVDNGAHAHLLAADALDKSGPRAAGKVYFISDGQPVVPWQWMNQIYAQLGLPELKRQIPLGAANALGATLELVWALLGLAGEPPMTRFLAAQLGTSHYYNLAAARRDLGYEPIVTPAIGVQRAVAWLKEELAAGRL